MEFKLTEERQMLADMIGRFLQNEYTIAARNKAAGSDIGFDQSVWGKLAELGVTGALFREESGGFGGKGFDIAVVFEALGRGLVVEPLLDGALLPGAVLAAAGNEQQKALLADVAGGQKRLALAHYENDSHSDTAYVATRAETGDGGWVLSGTKSVVKFAEGADAIIVSARTSGEAADVAGVSLFLVTPGTQGMTINSYTTIDGGSASEISFENVVVPAESLIGTVGEGFDVLESAFASGVLALCAEALGIMEVVKELTLEYLRTRKQFGVAIGRFQALQHRMAQVLL